MLSTLLPLPAALRVDSDAVLSLLYYLASPILFILFFMSVVRLAGLKQQQLGWVARTLRRWLATSSFLGFVIAFVLSSAALGMNNSAVDLAGLPRADRLRPKPFASRSHNAAGTRRSAERIRVPKACWDRSDRLSFRSASEETTHLAAVHSQPSGCS
jgi:hypothetical protein